MKNKNRILIETHQQAMDLMKQNYQALQKLGNNVLSSFAKIGAGSIESLDELKQASEIGGAAFLNDKLENFVGNDSLKVGALSLKKEKLAEMLSINEPVTFYQSLAAFVQQKTRHALDLKYLIYEEGKIYLNNTELDSDLFELHSRHISSDRGLDLYERSIAFVSAANDLQERLKAAPGFDLFTLPTIRQYIIWEGDKWKVNPDFLKRLTQVPDPVISDFEQMKKDMLTI